MDFAIDRQQQCTEYPRAQPEDAKLELACAVQRQKASVSFARRKVDHLGAVIVWLLYG